MQHSSAPRILRKQEILSLTGLSDVTLWRMEQANEFPKRVQLGKKSVGWLETEYNDWVIEKAAARTSKK